MHSSSCFCMLAKLLDVLAYAVDPEDGQAHDKTLKIRSQQERQTRAMQLSREGTLLSLAFLIVIHR